MKRRRFLKNTAAAAGTAAAGAGVFNILRHPRDAKAAGWGQWPQDRAELLIPDDMRVDKVLEVHFLGGISPWETFYCDPDWGTDVPGYLHLFDNDVNNPNSAFLACGLNTGGINYTENFAEDAIGRMISMGPWTAPLRRRPDIMSRMRVMVQHHENLAHEGANPIAFTGRSLGRPDLAGIGAHIQRYFLEQPGGERAVPYSFVLYPTGPGFSPSFAASASAIGFHPGAARPLSVQVQVDSDLSQLLERPGIPDGYRDQFDAALNYYGQAYGARFRPGGQGAATRSVERGNYDFANFSRRNAPELTNLLTSDLFEPLASTSCGGMLETANAADMSSMQARLAQRLLTDPETPARYVQWIDVGIAPNPAVGFDVHQGHVLGTAVNVPHTLEQLANIIATPEQDAEAEGLLDLDNTLIVLNMEFGRAPDRQGTGDGTNHWPYGYVTVMIGGPVSDDSRSPGSSIYGWISEDGQERGLTGENRGRAQEFITAAENRMMVLDAMGIYPFSSQSFAVSDIRGSADEIDAATQLRDRIWGLNV
ncbi:MAG: DUF1501 domain-containing protein [Nannocystaceae bacterium]|nr:DUF1501 domain-containing protein [Nannocystaceae bacterium]